MRKKSRVEHTAAVNSESSCYWYDSKQGEY